ncbi:MbeD/MobD family mobilization/exclusion protein [Escherichia coli]|uniref:MbeD/MobD family mobilization/exclusion protein n=1 Tax=Escherichia coli TaxID=562 RepID=UPI003EE228F1
MQPPHEPGHAPTTVRCLSSGQLREQCDDLSQQVQRLVEQVDHLSRLFITNSR